MIQNSKGARRMPEEGLLPTPVPKAFLSVPQGQLVLPNSLLSCQNASRHLQANIYQDLLFFFTQVVHTVYSMLCTVLLFYFNSTSQRFFIVEPREPSHPFFMTAAYSVV